MHLLVKYIVAQSPVDSCINYVDVCIFQVLIHFKHWLPGVGANGKAFETQTMLGKFLSPSCISESSQSPSVCIICSQIMHSQ